MKVHIATSMLVGEQCEKWASQNLPPGAELSSNEECEVWISVFYNKLISEEFIMSKKRCLNFHAGILPYYRGSATINWAIINGEKETGVTLHEIDRWIDHGPIIEIRKFPVDENETAESLFEKTEKVVFEMFKDWFAKIISGDYKAVPQDHSKAKLYLRKDFKAAQDLTKFAKAFHLPGREQAYYFNRKGGKIYLEW